MCEMSEVKVGRARVRRSVPVMLVSQLVSRGPNLEVVVREEEIGDRGEMY